MKRDKKKTLRNKADKLLQQYIKMKHKKCFIPECSKPINCGHHFVTKAHSNGLRYYLVNIVPLCLDHHCLVHNQPWKVEPLICFKKGKAWYNILMKAKEVPIKTNLSWYQSNVEFLERKINGLRTNNPVTG